VVAHAAEIAARTAPVKQIMRDAAAADPAVRRLLREDHQRRYLTQQALVDIVIGPGSLRAGCDREHAVASFYALVNSDGYQLLAGQLGWDLARWQRWLVGVLGHELLGNAANSTVP